MKMTVEGKDVASNVTIERNFSREGEVATMEVVVTATAAARAVAAACPSIVPPEPSEIAPGDLVGCSEGGIVIRLHDDDGSALATSSMDPERLFPLQGRSVDVEFKTRVKMEWTEEMSENLRHGRGTGLFHRTVRDLAQRTLDCFRV